jgi:hypothetical protein
MVSQAPITNGDSVVAPVRGFASLGHDIVKLAELQARLARVDLREFAQRAIIPSAVIATCMVIILAATVVALLGVSESIAERMELNRGSALLIVSILAIVLSLAGIVTAINKLRTATAPLNRSREELLENIRSIADALRQGDGIRMGHNRSN